MIGKAKSNGAISIVNAVASGRGASVAVELPTSARISISETRGPWRMYSNGARVESSLAVHTINGALMMLGKSPRKHSGTVETKTKVPSGVGLKTSSSSSVAIALAVLSAFGEKNRTDEVLELSATSSIKAGVSLTGAMDDAASCLLGGVNFSDNSAKKILSSSRLGRPLPVLIRVPRLGSRRALVSKQALRRFSRTAESIFSIGRDGRLWGAMTLNGLLFSSIYGYQQKDSMGAIAAGALGAGLSGTGPAVAAVFDNEEDLERVGAMWKAGGAVLFRTVTADGRATIGL